MFANIELFGMAHAMAVHAGTRQTLVARNVANADTPGYTPQQLARFEDSYKKGLGPGALRQTRGGHLGAGERVFELKSQLIAGSDPNGNNVSIEQEMLNAVDASRQHERALAIYKSSLSILRATLAR